MAENIKLNLTCGDAAILISRNLDGDLNRLETLQLYEHIVSCDQCRIEMSQISALGNSLDDLKKYYQGHSPSPQLKKSIHNIISKKKKYPKASNQNTSLLQKLKQRYLYLIIYKPALGVLGMALVLSMSIIFWWQGAFEQTLSQERFVVHEFPLRTAEDLVNWNQQHTILPSQTIQLNVLEAHPDPYFFRVSSPNSKGGTFSLTHNQMRQKLEKVQKLNLNGIQYITLKNPQLEDTIHIHNHGTQRITVKTFSYRPQAIQANFK